MNKQLTSEQRKVAVFNGGHAIVKAVPGSGKSTTLVKRISTLLTRGIPHDKILVLMFNKSAQRKFTEDLIKESKRKQFPKLPDVKTFDGFAFSVLKRAENKGLINRKVLTSSGMGKVKHDKLIKKSYQVGYQDNSGFIEMSLLQELALDIEIWRLNELEPDDLYNGPEFKYIVIDRKRAYQYYCDNIANADIMTFTDQMRIAIGLIRSKSSFEFGFEHIIVDEYQDVNRLQHQLIKCLCNAQTSVMVVGDINQCIYKFRGSNPDFIGGIFEKEFKYVTEFFLSVTFRYGHQVSYISNTLIYKNNKSSQLCVSHKDAPNTLVSLQQQAKLNSIINRINIANLTNESSAVIARTNADLIYPMICLRMLNIPFKMDREAKPLVEHSVIAFIAIVLRIAIKCEHIEQDATLFTQSIIQNFVKHSGLSKSYAKTTQAISSAFGRNQFLENLISLNEGKNELNSDVIKRLLCIENKFKSDSSAFVVLNELISGRILENLGRNTPNRIDSNDEMRVLDVLLDVLKNHPITVLELLGLFSETPTVEQVYAQFEITTIHKAKGLEWDNVILIGLYDERFPSDKKGGIIEQSPNALKEALDGNLEEERRLFYVAITRVKKRLYLLHPEDDMFVKRVRDGWYSTPKKGNVATRFLYEMDYKGADAVNSYLNFQTDSKYPSEYKLGKKYIYGYKQLNGVTKQK